MDAIDRSYLFNPTQEGNYGHYFRQIGKLMVTDALTGNDDRFNITSEKGITANWGNLMFTDDSELIAIDNEMREGNLNTVGQDKGGALETPKGDIISQLLDNRTDEMAGPEVAKLQEKVLPNGLPDLAEDSLEIFLEGFLRTTVKQMGEAAQAYVAEKLQENKVGIDAAFREGIEQGKIAVKALIDDQERMAKLKAKTIKLADEIGTKMWGTLEERGKYMLDRY